MNKNIMIVGVGGQGTLLTSRIIGKAALAAGLDVKILQDGVNAVIYGARCMLDQKIFDR